MINITNEDNMLLMARYPDNHFDLAIVDPPYGINVGKMAYTQEDNRPVKQKNGKTLRVKKLKYKHGDWDKEIPKDKYFKELFRVSKNQIIWGIKHFNIPNLGDGVIKWNKCVPKGVSFNNYEHAYCSLINKEIEFTYMWAGMMQGISVVRPTIQQGNKKLNEKRIHPTQKPVKLYEWLLMNYAEEGDKILDTHLGSGSIALACHNLNYDLTACELDKDYYNDAMKRLKQHQQQLTMF